MLCRFDEFQQLPQDLSVSLSLSLPLQPLVKFRSHLYYEDKDDVPEALKNLKPLEGSRIKFFKSVLLIVFFVISIFFC